MRALEETHALDIARAKDLMARNGACITTFVLYTPEDPDGRVILPLPGMPKNDYLEVMRRFVLAKRAEVERYSYLAESWFARAHFPAGTTIEQVKAAAAAAGPIAQRDDRIEALFVLTCEPGKTLTTALKILRTTAGDVTGYAPHDVGDLAFHRAGRIYNYFEDRGT